MERNKEFNAIVFTGNLSLGNKGYITYHKISSLNRFRAFIETKFPEWKFATLYDRKTNERTLIKP